MRIGWATPFNVRSAIGKFSKMVCEELATRGHEVDIIRIESGPELGLDQIASDLCVLNASNCDVDEYDALVVNFGNHVPYHAQLISLLAQRAPIGVFHDMEMRDFEWGLMDRHGMNFPYLHGVKQEIAATDYSDMVDPDARPVLATLAAMTSGAIIHGPHYRETIAAFCPGTVDVVRLCFPDTGTARKASRPAAKPRVTIFGMINENKQASRVIEALALIRARFGDVELHLAGAAESRIRDALLAQARKLGLKPPIFHGYVSDSVLQDIIESSHAVCCLRYPVTEGGSASLVTALFRARPLVISDVASYSMVPDDLAAKVSYGTDPADLAEALARIFSAPEEAAEKAERARMWADEQYSARTYVDVIEPLLLVLPEREPLTSTARRLIPAVTAPSHDPIPLAIEAFAKVLDWMEECQGSSKDPNSRQPEAMP